MSVGSTLEKIFIFFGKDANPALVAMGIAGAKAIFRPTFTLMDKEQDPKSKCYAALREGLTEIIAIGVYYGSGKLATGIAKSLAKPKDMAKDTFKGIISGKSIPNGMTDDAARALKNNFFKMNSTLSMLGVFASALLVIPAVCSAVIKPFMSVINKEEEKHHKKHLDVDTAAPVKVAVYTPSFQYNNGHKVFNTFPDRFPSYSSGMKVGGV